MGRSRDHQMDVGSVVAYVDEVERAHKVDVVFSVRRAAGVWHELLQVTCKVSAPVLVAPGQHWSHSETAMVPTRDHPTLEGAMWYLLFLCDNRAAVELYKQQQFA